MAENPPKVNDDRIPIEEVEQKTITNMKDAIVTQMNEYGEKIVKDLQKEFDKQVGEIMAKQEAELIKGIREGLGLDDNPVVHLKDLQAIVRDMVLENADPKKKSTLPVVRDPPVLNEDDPFKKYDFTERLAKEWK